MSKYRQYGENILYPETIETWKLGDKVPEWLSDICQIHFEGSDIKLTTGSRTSGGYEIYESGPGKRVFLSTGSDSDSIARTPDGHYLVLSEKMLELMYIKEK